MKKWIKTDLIILIVCVAYYTAIYFLNTTCLIKFIFNTECPTCGTTRALVCLLTGNIRGYVFYNYLALPLIITVYGCIHFDEKLKKVFNYLAVILAIALIVRYIFLHF